MHVAKKAKKGAQQKSLWLDYKKKPKQHKCQC